MADDTGDLARALRSLSSANQGLLRGLAREVLEGAGLSPFRLSDALHSSPRGGRPSVLAAVRHDGDPARARYAAAWYGLKSGEPAVLAFHADPGGPDALYMLHLSGSAEDIARALDGHGIPQRTLVPSERGFRVYIHDKGLSLRERVARFGVNHDATIHESRGAGERLGAGSGADARAEYRRVIDAYERGGDSGGVPGGGTDAGPAATAVQGGAGRAALGDTPARFSRWGEPVRGPDAGWGYPRMRQVLLDIAQHAPLRDASGGLTRLGRLWHMAAAGRHAALAPLQQEILDLAGRHEGGEHPVAGLFDGSGSLRYNLAAAAHVLGQDAGLDLSHAARQRRLDRALSWTKSLPPHRAVRPRAVRLGDIAAGSPGLHEDLADTRLAYLLRRVQADHHEGSRLHGLATRALAGDWSALPLVGEWLARTGHEHAGTVHWHRAAGGLELDRRVRAALEAAGHDLLDARDAFDDPGRRKSLERAVRGVRIGDRRRTAEDLRRSLHRVADREEARRARTGELFRQRGFSDPSGAHAAYLAGGWESGAGVAAPYGDRRGRETREVLHNLGMSMSMPGTPGGFVPGGPADRVWRALNDGEHGAANARRLADAAVREREDDPNRYRRLRYGMWGDLKEAAGEDWRRIKAGVKSLAGAGRTDVFGALGGRTPPGGGYGPPPGTHPGHYKVWVAGHELPEGEVHPGLVGDLKGHSPMFDAERPYWEAIGRDPHAHRWGSGLDSTLRFLGAAGLTAAGAMHAAAFAGESPPGHWLHAAHATALAGFLGGVAPGLGRALRGVRAAGTSLGRKAYELATGFGRRQRPLMPHLARQERHLLGQYLTQAGEDPRYLHPDGRVVGRYAAAVRNALRLLPRDNDARRSYEEGTARYLYRHRHALENGVGEQSHPDVHARLLADWLSEAKPLLDPLRREDVTGRQYRHAGPDRTDVIYGAAGEATPPPGAAPAPGPAALAEAPPPEHAGIAERQRMWDAGYRPARDPAPEPEPAPPPRRRGPLWVERGFEEEGRPGALREDDRVLLAMLAGGTPGAHPAKKLAAAALVTGDPRLAHRALDAAERAHSGRALTRARLKELRRRVDGRMRGMARHVLEHELPRMREWLAHADHA